MSDEIFSELLAFFKALADANRLRIIGLLARQALSVEQLAEMLELKPSTVSHHLARLAEAGLVSARAESYYNVYRLESEALEDLSRRLLTKDTLPNMAASVDMDAYDRKVIATFTTPDGRIKALPAQRKKFEAILRYVLKPFQPGVRYSEKQVNELLAQYFDDTATLRRELVDYHMLSREGGGGAYWRSENASTQ